MLKTMFSIRMPTPNEQKEEQPSLLIHFLVSKFPMDSLVFMFIR